MAQSYTRGDEPIAGYRLVKFLGRGAFGEVWKATGPGGTECALKIINLVDKQGFKEFRAIRLVKRIHHPNLVPIIGFWLKDEQGNVLEDAGEADSVWLKGKEAELFIAMGLGAQNLGDRLKECLDQGKPGIPTEELLDYMEEAAKAIDFLNQPRHDLGSGPVSIQHCDIKPQNILIVGGSAQVCDFGLARQLNDVRQTSTAAGTYAYIAPESIENQPSKSNDQYSLAISYVELRTGSLPFNVNSLYEVMFIHLEGKLDFSKLPEAERTVLKRATALKPNDRFPSTSEMVKALRRAIEGKPTSKPEVSFSGPPRGLLQPDIEIVPGYKLVRFIGRGGYGEVWEAKAPGGKLVALKIIRNLEAAGGKQEFKALELIKSVDHNHLMELHAYWLLDANGQIIPDEVRKQPNAPVASILVIATKLANKNLLERLEECRELQGGEGGIPLPELLVYARQAADAIDYLNAPHHTLGDRQVSILHRDIKPENILLSANTVKVTDFGLAKVVEGTSAVIHGDSAGLTLSYAAPEVFSNTVTSWSDQYSLAVTYFHLRTGKLPFRATAPTEIFVIHVEGRLDLDALPEPERKVIARATAKDPQGRFPTCTEMVRALEEACGVSTAPSIAVGARPGSGPSLPGKRGSESDPTVATPAQRSPLPGTDRPKDKTSPHPPSSVPAPASPTPRQGGVKPELNPYITLTESLQPGNLVLAELKQDTDPARRDTDRLQQGTPPGSEPTIDYRSGPPPVAPPPVIKQAPVRRDWKNAETTEASEPSGKRAVGRIKIAGAFLVIAGALSLGVWVVIGPPPHPTPTAPQQFAEHIKSLIRDAKFREACAELEKVKAKLTDAGTKKLQADLVEGWLKPVEADLKAERYRRAAEALAEVRGCYPRETRVSELGDLLEQALSRLHEQGLNFANSPIMKEWQQAFTIAKTIADEFPNEIRLAQEIRDRAMSQGKSLRAQKLANASKEQEAPQACALFKQVFDLSQALDEHGPEKGLADGIWNAWCEYGQNRLNSRPEDSRKVAESMLAVRKDNAQAKRLATSAETEIKASASNTLVSDYAKFVSQGNAAQARETVKRLVKEIARLAKNGPSILVRLAEPSKELSALVRKSTPDQKQEILNLLTELDGLGCEPLVFDVALARALLAARDRNYELFGSELARACEAKVKDTKRLEETLAEVIQLCLKDESSTHDGRKLLLDKITPVLGNPPTVKTAGLGEAYSKLVAKLIGESLADLKEPQDYRTLLGYCRAANNTGQAGAVTLACLAECLLLQRDGKLVPPPSATDLEEARQVLATEAVVSSPEPYVTFVRGLNLQVKEEYLLAAGKYQEAFKIRPLTAVLSSQKRCAFAAEACYRAGKLYKNSAQTALPYYRFANSLLPKPQRDYQQALLSAAAELRSVEFGDLVRELSQSKALDVWKGTDSAELGNLFVRWADMQAMKVFAAAVAADLDFALQAALEKSPKDVELNLWMGMVHWRRKANEAERRNAYVCFGRVLAKSKAPLDEFERRAYDAIGSDAHDRLAAVSSALPTDRTKLSARDDTQLLLKRLVLILDNGDLLKEDCLRETPMFLADADDVARLKPHPAFAAQAHVAVWNIVTTGFNKVLISEERAGHYQQQRAEHLAKLEELLLLDKTYEWKPALIWAKHCRDNTKDPERAMLLQKMIDRYSAPPPQRGLKQPLGRQKTYA